MGQIIIRRNSGLKFLVELAGHDTGIGRIECIVSLPPEQRQRVFDSDQRRAVLKKAKELVEAFNAELLDAAKL
jgi:hypothetical protein